jgi:hypothetical protein
MNKTQHAVGKYRQEEIFTKFATYTPKLSKIKVLPYSFRMKIFLPSLDLYITEIFDGINFANASIGHHICYITQQKKTAR